MDHTAVEALGRNFIEDKQQRRQQIYVAWKKHFFIVYKRRQSKIFNAYWNRH